MTFDKSEADSAVSAGVNRRARARRAPVARFSQADVKRALGALESVGAAVAAVDFPPEGGFRLLLGQPASLNVLRVGQENEWDSVLPS